MATPKDFARELIEQMPDEAAAERHRPGRRVVAADEIGEVRERRPVEPLAHAVARQLEPGLVDRDETASYNFV